MNADKISRHKVTRIVCPQCGKPTGSALHLGGLIAYCRHCKIEIEVTIHLRQESTAQDELTE